MKRINPVLKDDLVSIPTNNDFGSKVTVILLAVFSTVLAVSPVLADSTITDQEDCETNLLGSWSDLGDGSGECHH